MFFFLLFTFKVYKKQKKRYIFYSFNKGTRLVVGL